MNDFRKLINLTESYNRVLTEYVDPEKTALQMGDKLMAKLENDPSAPTNVKRMGAKAFIEFVSSNVDPTENHQYTLWILRTYHKNGIARYEDFNRVGVALEIFHKFKRQMQTRDINQIKNLPALEDLVQPYVDAQTGKEQKKDISDKIRSETEVFYNGPEGMILIPKTEEASCFWGKGTRWCTAATSSNNYFDMYNRQGPLYIVMPKDGTKWQLHTQSKQFLDSNDRPFNIDEWSKKYPWAAKELLKVYPDIQTVEYTISTLGIEGAKEYYSSVIENGGSLPAKFDEQAPDEIKYYIYDTYPEHSPFRYEIDRYGWDNKDALKAVLAKVAKMDLEYNTDYGYDEDFDYEIANIFTRNEINNYIYPNFMKRAPAKIRLLHNGAEHEETKEYIATLLNDQYGWKLQGDEFIIGNYESKADLANDFGLSDLESTLKQTEEHDDVDVYMGGLDYDDMLSYFPEHYQRAIEKYLQDNVDPDDADHDNISEMVDVEDGPIKQALESAHYYATIYGIQNEMYTATESWFDDSGIKVEYDGDTGKHRATVSYEKMADIIKNYDDPSVYFEDMITNDSMSDVLDLSDLSTPYYGWDGYDEKAGVDAAMDELPEEVDKLAKKFSYAKKA